MRNNVILKSCMKVPFALHVKMMLLPSAVLFSLTRMYAKMDPAFQVVTSVFGPAEHKNNHSGRSVRHTRSLQGKFIDNRSVQHTRSLQGKFIDNIPWYTIYEFTLQCSRAERGILFHNVVILQATKC